MTNRELDALVAERVMGWTQERWNDDCRHEDPASMPHYSADISDAFQVAEKLLEMFDPVTKSGVRTLGFVLEIHTEDSGDRWMCRLPSVTCVPPYEEMDSHAVFASADTAAEAICLAALKAVGVPDVKP